MCSYVSIFGTIVASLAGLGFAIWAWGSFLDTHEHSPAKVRSAMLIILGIVSLCDASFAFFGLTHHWAACVVLASNLWGSLDALLRFPAAHDLESFFTVKQLLLLFANIFAYAFGIIGFRAHTNEFVAILILRIWALPVLYLMALPLNPANQVADNDRDDVDLVVRVWELSTCRTERQRCLKTCRAWFHRGLFAVSKQSHMAKTAICAASPLYRRAFSKERWSV